MDLTNYKSRAKGQVAALQEMLVYGKVPPQARDLEVAILGAVLMEKEAFPQVSELLKPECFYVDAHQRVFRAMQDLAGKSQPIDILTVIEELKFREELDIVGGPFFVSQLTDRVVSAANIEAHSRIVLQKFIQRELIRISGEIITEAYEDSTDVFDLLQTAENSLKDVTQRTGRSDIRHVGDVLVETIQNLEELRGRDEHLTGIPSGFQQLDTLTCGWQDTDLIILAARPSKGKTALALNMAANAALSLRQSKRERKGVGIFSLEMKDRQQVQRMLAKEARVYLRSIRDARLDDEQMKHLYRSGVQKLGQLPIYIVDKGGLTLVELRAKVRRMVNHFNCGLIIIDYLQLINGATEGKKNSNREQEISTISRNLKQLAMECNVPIIALSQLSREIEKRTDQEPQLSDLRESGSLEQDADMVLFIYSYPKNEIAKNPQLKDRKLLKVAKYRNGDLETIEYEFNGGFQTFTELGVYSPGFVTMLENSTLPSGSWRQLPKENDFPDYDDNPF